ncbi:ABCB family ABC transporter ATP-binding protein/permease [Lysobacter tyrosinilyticus]
MSLTSAPAWTTARLIFRRLLPTLWAYRGRVLLALALLLASKLAAIAVPMQLKWLVDRLGAKPGVVELPLMLVLAYGAARLSTSVFVELRGIVFARVTARTTRHVALQVFSHLHALSLRFHLNKRTGAVSRDLERGVSSISDLLEWTLYSILPTLLEVVIVCGILVVRYDASFALIALGTIAAYVIFTIVSTQWRMRIYRAANEADTEVSAVSVDSLMNYETVKYFNNERYELERYDQRMRALETSIVRNLQSRAVLNIGQEVIVATGLALLLWRASAGVVAGTMTLGDFVLVNAFLLQLAAPLNFLGFVYRQIRETLGNLERIFALVDEPCEVVDSVTATELELHGGTVRFEDVGFRYEAGRGILDNVNFCIPAGHTVAVVGPTGAGKSTLARLLLRFYDPTAGRISIDGRDVRDVTQSSLRKAIGVVPQDTVLFNDTIYFNIAYGRPDASRDEVMAAAQAAHIHTFIASLPEGYDTLVGERGVKLSGGEKQRVAIARALLKNPAILIFDEATSALDTHTEQVIQEELAAISRSRTTLVVAHRLSTIVDADLILVLANGHVAEQGTHLQLLEKQGLYAKLWALQRREQVRSEHEPEIA